MSGIEGVNERQLWLRELAEAAAGPVAPHPGENHEFRTVCLRCGERGYLHVAVITDLEVVKVEPRAAIVVPDFAP